MAVGRPFAALSVLAMLAGAGPASTQSVDTEIRGVDGELRANVAAMLSLAQAADLEQVSVWRLRRMATEAVDEVREALAPFGYYSPDVAVRLIEPEVDGGRWNATVDIEPGQPVAVARVDIAISEPAASLDAFRQWRADWPLPEGRTLRHPPYERALSGLQRLAEAHGFFDAGFAERVIRVDPAVAEAGIDIDFDAGPRYSVGTIDRGDSGFNPDLMRALTVVEPGQPYTADAIDRQREVLVRTGYFDQVVVAQERRPDSHEVDLSYDLTRREPNTYSAMAGFGTDTGVRGQLGWTRHYLSGRGDRLETRFGAQQTDSEFVLRSNYQLPYGGRPGNFFTAEALLKREQDRFRFEDNDRIEPVFESFSGSRDQIQFSVGRLRKRALLEGFEPLTEQLFVTFLNEQFDAFSAADLSAEQTALLDANPGLRPFLDTDTNTAAIGGDWTLFRIEGDGFAEHGLFARARVLGSLEALGSGTSFLQGYAEGRWHWHFLPRHKLLLRGQLGYTQAATETLDLSIPGDPRRLELDITELPELFRFKAGGDRSVRGYGFEALSTNRNGANHTLVGSLEYEYNLFGDWSAAAFYDIGNAFNDFAEAELKRGAGVGLRWYTVIGPVQLDLARALDDDSFRIHFTIGTKLL